VSTPLPQVVIHTDGACSSSTSLGGYAAVLTGGGHWAVVHGTVDDTTNNRMELQAIVESVKMIDGPAKITVISDSKYALQRIERRATDLASNWQSSKGQPLANQDLLRELSQVLAPHQVTGVYVKGHAGDHGNETVDWFARRNAGTLKPSELK